MANSFYRPDSPRLNALCIASRAMAFDARCKELDDITVATGFPATGSPWMKLTRPGAEWWLSFNEESVLRGLDDCDE